MAMKWHEGAIKCGCSPSQGGLYYWSYLYYLSKYYELLDTLLIVLKVRDLANRQSLAEPTIEGRTNEFLAKH